MMKNVNGITFLSKAQQKQVNGGTVLDLNKLCPNVPVGGLCCFKSAGVPNHGTPGDPGAPADHFNHSPSGTTCLPKV